MGIFSLKWSWTQEANGLLVDVLLVSFGYLKEIVLAMQSKLDIDGISVATYKAILEAELKAALKC